MGTSSSDPEFSFMNKDTDTELHTSCSAPLVVEPPVTGTVDGETLEVVSQIGGSGDGCPEFIGGSGFIIDKTSLLVAGIQAYSVWLIPVLVAAVGIGIIVTRKLKDSNKS